MLYRRGLSRCWLRYKGKQDFHRRACRLDISRVKYSTMESRDIEIGDRKKGGERGGEGEGENGGKPVSSLGSREIRRLTGPVLSANHLIEQNLSSRGQRCRGTGKLRIPRWVLLDGFLSGSPKVSGFKFQLAVPGQAECFGICSFSPTAAPCATTIRVTPANFTTAELCNIK